MRFTMSQDTPGSTATAPAASVPSDQQGDAFENLLHENSAFAPTPEFAADAVCTAADYAEAE
ncbi:MAG TPA: hypothetical protein DDY41_00390, partial [Arthrobacter bacterium]|nr:hypothetical protein [Arthrobacter sp.]